jgi:multiple sugar transport system ATP-binding protein
VFLMDEPLSNLDAQLRVQMRAEVSRIQKRLAVATVYVTHDQIEAMTMGSRVAVMRNGSVQQCDAPQSLYDRPANLFVAGFIGSPSMNLYEAVVGAGARSLRLGAQEITLSDQVTLARPALASHSGRKVIIGLRPEHLPAAGPADSPVIEGDVDLVEALGNELLVHFSTEAQRITTEGVLEEDEQLTTRGAGVARVDTRTPMKPGERGRFAVDVERMQFFDAETEQAIWD